MVQYENLTPYRGCFNPSPPGTARSPARIQHYRVTSRLSDARRQTVDLSDFGDRFRWAICLDGRVALAVLHRRAHCRDGSSALDYCTDHRSNLTEQLSHLRSTTISLQDSAGSWLELGMILTSAIVNGQLLAR